MLRTLAFGTLLGVATVACNDTGSSGEDGPDAGELDSDQADADTGVNDLAGDPSSDPTGDAVSDRPVEPPDDSEVGADAVELSPYVPHCGPIVDGTTRPARSNPCRAAQRWPDQLSSDRYPLLVHYGPGEECWARDVLALVEYAWSVEVDELGFRPPPADGGSCGPDDRFDVFVWPGLEVAYVEAIEDIPETDWNDWIGYLAVDPLGPYGNDLLDATIAHELNHACQAADDWWDSPLAFEMTATYMEEVVFDEDDTWHPLAEDFQSRPDWSLDRNDDYETWYMYAAALYLVFLSERYFDGAASFTADMWEGMRGPPGAENDQELNEPDFLDALDDLLSEQAGVDYAQSVVEFARWRWYTGERDDGRHIEEAADFALVPLAGRISAAAATTTVDPAPMAFGSAYVEIEGDANQTLQLSVDGSDQVDWVVQAVPGLQAGSDGDLLDLTSGVADLTLTDQGTRVVILTAIPLGPYDPDTRDDSRYEASVSVAR